MSTSLTPGQKADDEVQLYVADLAKQGLSDATILNDLASRGMNQAAAQAAVDKLSRTRRNAHRRQGLQTMAIGLVIFAVGLIISISTLSAAIKSGGTVVLAVGAIVSGALAFVNGVYQYRKK